MSVKNLSEVAYKNKTVLKEELDSVVALSVLYRASSASCYPSCPCMTLKILESYV